MKLYKYYSLYECSDCDFILDKLKEMKKQGKIEFDIDGDIIKIEDFDLDTEDINYLNKIFYEYDVYPYLDREEEEEDDNQWNNIYDEDNYYEN